MKKSRLGTCFLIGGLSVLFLAVVATLFLATHTREGALCMMILKAMDILNAYVVASVVVIAGTTTAIYAVSRLLGSFPEDDRKDGDENKNDEN